MCAVNKPDTIIERIAEAMRETMDEAAGDDRIPPGLLSDMRVLWETGQAHAGRASRR